MTILGFINRVVCQWFGFRITRYVERVDDKIKTIGWGLLLGVYPLTGWNSDYKGPQIKIKLIGK